MYKYGTGTALGKKGRN